MAMVCGWIQINMLDYKFGLIFFLVNPLSIVLFQFGIKFQFHQNGHLSLILFHQTINQLIGNQIANVTAKKSSNLVICIVQIGLLMCHMKAAIDFSAATQAIWNPNQSGDCPVI